MKFIVYLLALILSVSFFYACDNDDNFSASSDLRLTFSSDTVKFDTVFTTIGTATKRLKIYNRNNNAISISNIELLSPQRTGFRMNVDGESGNSIQNVDILGKDSVYAFIEVTVDPLNQNSPLLISDSIRFQFNGVTQYVRLEAIGQDVIIWNNKTITENTTITGEKPFLIYNTLHVAENATLHMEKNTRLYFHSNAGMLINGKIEAVGTIAEPVVFRGDRMDNLFEAPPLSYDRIPGQWKGITLASNSYNNRFENVRIRNGIYGIVCQASDTSQTKVELLNTVIQNTTKEGLSSVNSKIDAKNCLVANSGTHTVKLIGGSYNFLHCTIANYMNYTGTFKKGTLTISNSGKDENEKDASAALGTCRFISTIVSGSSNTNEIEIKPTQGMVFRYHFLNCLLNTNGTDDENFVNTVWNQNPLFKYIYSTGDAHANPNLYFYYDFSLTENSPARNHASRQYAAELPEDIVGKSRRSDEAPDIGCFEWKES